MNHLLAVDPSLRGTGWALFENEVLTRCGVFEGPPGMSRIEGVSALMKAAAAQLFVTVNNAEVVLEFPRIYPKGAQERRTDHVDPNDLLWVAAVAGAFAAQANTVKSYYPSDWKGQSKKEKTLRLVLQACTPAERAVIERVTGHKRHNAVDAVGIGMYHLKRIGRNVLRELP